jgi:hypothetical protein
MFRWKGEDPTGSELGSEFDTQVMKLINLTAKQLF